MTLKRVRVPENLNLNVNVDQSKISQKKKLKDINDKNSPKRVKIEKEIYEIDKFIKDSFAHDLKMEEEKAIKVIKKSNKFYYSYAKKKSKTKITIGPFMDNNNKVINDPHTMGDMLKTRNKSVQSKPKSEKIVLDPISFFKTDNDFTLNDINFNQNDVKKAMLEVSVTAAPGRDYFPALLLNKCADTLSTPIYIIWRKSLDLGKIPSLTKDALVSPIHKGDSRALPKYYRPISLTSHIINVSECIIRKQLVDHLEDNNIMSPNQHGFRSGRSCLSQLLAQYDLVLRQMEEGKKH